MTNTPVTLDNALSLLMGSRTIREVNSILEEVGRLTYTKIKDIQNNIFSAERLRNAGCNPFMSKIMQVAEVRKQEISN